MIGLTLSGGGAKGAYHVGAVEALQECGVRVDRVSGASIGALNGALISSAPDLRSAAMALEGLWRDLGETNPIRFDVASFAGRMAAAAIAARAAGGAALLAPLLTEELKLCSDAPLLRLFSKHLDFEALQRGKPLHVSLYEAGRVPVLRAALAERRIWDTPDSTFLHLQALPAPDQTNALLASAAIPVLYGSRKIGRVRYSDGGQGGWRRSQGNTPVAPLIAAGCELIFVIRLTDEPWERPAAPGVIFVDLRPLRPIRRKGGPLNMRDVLSFDPETLRSWRLQGYRDTMEILSLPFYAEILRDFGVTRGEPQARLHPATG